MSQKLERSGVLIFGRRWSRNLIAAKAARSTAEITQFPGGAPAMIDRPSARFTHTLRR